MPKKVTYSRRTLPQESKRIPPPRLGTTLPLPQMTLKKTPPFQGPGPIPVNLVLPVSRISAPR